MCAAVYTTHNKVDGTLPKECLKIEFKKKKKILKLF